MKGFGLAFGLFSAVSFLLWTPLTGLKTLHLGSCVITANLQGIQKEFSEIQESVVRKRGDPSFLSVFTPFVCLSSQGIPGSLLMKTGRMEREFQSWTVCFQEMPVLSSLKRLSLDPGGEETKSFDT